jgi:GT2 family glycosyltransferase
MPEEIIIVDSSDIPVNTSSWFSQLCAPLASRVQYYHTAPGLTRQRNDGARHATGDIIHFIDDDVVLEADYLKALHITFSRYTTCVGGMGTIVPIPQSGSLLFRIFRIIFLLPRDHASGKCTLSGMPTFSYGTAHFKYVEVLGGCCMSFRRYYFLKEMADEVLHGYCCMEDCDLSFRMRRWGKLFYQPQARHNHYNSPQARDTVRQSRAMFLRNAIYLFFKNWYTWWRVPFFIWSVIGIFFEAVVTRNWRALCGYYDALRHIRIVWSMLRSS